MNVIFSVLNLLQEPKNNGVKRKSEPDVVGKALIYFDQKLIKKYLSIIKRRKKNKDHSSIYLKDFFHSFGCKNG